jgi:hypothetical protein
MPILTRLLSWLFIFFVLLKRADPHQNPVGANLWFDEQAPEKTGQRPGFSIKSEVAFSKSGILKKP